jgi:hypothetical protein
MRLFALIAVAVLVSTLPQRGVRADMAPPETPPGSNVLPGSETTQVRMMAETVTLTVAKDYSDVATAQTQAVFTMRNLGTSGEKMPARFPLSFFDGSSDGYFKYPEIPSITVKVDGKRVPTRREMQAAYNPNGLSRERTDIPWAVFDVSFPPGQDVKVEVTYTVKSYGYYPQDSFRYILQTGAGWNGTIGSADIIVQLPYEANGQNVVTTDSSEGAVLHGNEIRWHYDDLEPTSENNLRVTLVAPSLWKSVLTETDTVTRDPNDGEAWGRLGKAYKEAARTGKGFPRDDPAWAELVALSASAYQKCLALLPKDPLWHYGYADLLWDEYWWADRRSAAENLLPQVLTELQTTLALDPGNSQAKDLLGFVDSSVPGALEVSGNNYVFLGLTATPLPPTDYVVPAAETPVTTPENTTAPPAPTPAASTQSPASPPVARNPLCGGSALLLVLPAAVLAVRRFRPRTGKAG